MGKLSLVDVLLMLAVALLLFGTSRAADLGRCMVESRAKKPRPEPVPEAPAPQPGIQSPAASEPPEAETALEAADRDA